MSTAAETGVPPLEYEQRKPLHQRRVPRQAFKLVVGAVLLSLIWYYTPSLKEFGIASWHRQCANYVAPQGRVVYDDDPATYASLLNAPDYRSNLLRQDRPYAIYDHPAWQGLAKAQYAGRVAPAVFLGVRISPGGNRRLVAVQYGTVYPDPKWNRICFIATLQTTSRTGLWIRSAGPGGAGGGGQFELYRQPADNVRIFDGQLDPKDASRFTIDVQINGTTHTVDGQLQDNDTVTLTPRNSRHVTYMNMAYWNPTGVAMPDWLQKLPPSPASQPASAGR